MVSFGLSCSEKPNEVMVFSADGRYTNDEKYLLAKVIDSEVSFTELNLEYKGQLVNPSSVQLNDIALVIDLYTSHELIEGFYTSYFQCVKPLGIQLDANKKISFSGVCENIPKHIATRYKKHRISIGKTGT